MGQRAAAPHGVMESGGSYNLHSAIPAGGAGLALPLLEQAARIIALDSTDQPLVIADYGSSQGKNSHPPLRAAISTLRGRVGPARPIIVVHVDQPANDFNTLFEVLHADPERYSLDDARHRRHLFYGWWVFSLPPNPNQGRKYRWSLIYSKFPMIPRVSQAKRYRSTEK